MTMFTEAVETTKNALETSGFVITVEGNKITARQSAHSIIIENQEGEEFEIKVFNDNKEIHSIWIDGECLLDEALDDALTELGF